MKKTIKSTYDSPFVRVAPCRLELNLLASANVPGAGIDDVTEEEWTVS